MGRGTSVTQQRVGKWVEAVAVEPLPLMASGRGEALWPTSLSPDLTTHPHSFSAHAVPHMTRIALVASDPALSALVLSRLARVGEYLPVLESPRLQRPDSPLELARLLHAIELIDPSEVVLVGRDRKLRAILSANMGSRTLHRVGSFRTCQARLLHLLNADPESAVVTTCRASDLALGLLRARVESAWLEFDETSPPMVAHQMIGRDQGHVVWLDDRRPVAQLLAAEYAYATNAELRLLPQRSAADVRVALDAISALAPRSSESQRRSASSLVARTSEATIALLGAPPSKFGTFITTGYPYGYFLGSVPTTHLFSHPHLGQHVARAMASLRPGGPRCNRALVVDPGHLPDTETEAVRSDLAHLGFDVRVLDGSRATTHRLGRALERVPLSTLFICSHCGLMDGRILTIRYTSRNGKVHLVEFEQATTLSLADEGEGDDRMVEVVHFYRVLSLDAVPWFESPDRPSTASEIWEHLRSPPENGWDVVSERRTDAIQYTTAIQTADSNLMLSTVRMAPSRPGAFVFNNACVSFVDAALALTLWGARGYVGTLSEVDNEDAREMAEVFFKEIKSGALTMDALWNAQRSVYASEAERSYVHVGPHFTSLP